MVKIGLQVLLAMVWLMTWAGCGSSGGGLADGGGDGWEDGLDGEGDQPSGDGDPAPADGDAADPDGDNPLEDIVLSPESVTVEVGMAQSLLAIAHLADGSDLDVTADVIWVLEPNSPVSVEGGLLRGLVAGTTTVRARIGAVMSQGVLVSVLPHSDFEARGVWVTRWDYGSAADVQAIVAQVADAGFNQLYFQIRGNADAYYASAVEPWASGLSGALGRDPGWDPLQEAIDAAHAAGLEVHAWLNTMPAWSCALGAPVSEGIPHVLQEHPEWAAADESGTSMYGSCSDGYVFLSPGIPEVQDHIRAVVRDLITNYAVDGIHLDYIRYGGSQYSHDAVSEARFAEAQAADPGLTWADWQRDQISAVVAGIYDVILSNRPDVVLSAAVWFIRENIWGWSAVSEGYHQYYQDPRAWTAGGYIDAIVPMIYFPLTDPPGQRLDFAAMLQDHLDGAADRFVYAGIHGDYASFAEIQAEVDLLRERGARGAVIFSHTYLESHQYWDDFAAGPWAAPAASPGLPWRQDLP